MTSGVLSHITPKGGVSIKISNEDKKGLEAVEPNVPDLKDLHLATGEDKHYKQSKFSWLTLTATACRSVSGLILPNKQDLF